MSLSWILLLVLILIQFVSVPPLLTRAGLEGWKGYVPFLNWVVWLKMIQRPWWWLFLLLVPGVNLIMITIMHVETGIAFGKRSTGEQWFAAVLPWVFLPKLAFADKNAEFLGPRDWTGKKKSPVREWGEAIVFAIVAASVIRTFFFEAFTIPTPSMEGSMLVGDYLFVSKMSYGAKSPQTPLSIPFVHNTIPGTLIDSYSEALSLPYFRLPGFGDVERFDPVVFNFPHGDTIVVDPNLMGHDYYGILIGEAMYTAGGVEEFRKNKDKFMAIAHDNLARKKVCYSCQRDPNLMSKRVPLQTGGIKSRPIDKCENYVKRCIGLPGEDLQIINQVVHIDGKPIENPEEVQFSYALSLNQRIDEAKLHQVVPFVHSELQGYGANALSIPLTSGEYNILSKKSFVKSLEPIVFDSVEFNNMDYFPNTDHPAYNTWTNDFYGPVHIPAKGETIALDETNIHLYKRAIRVYEGNDLELKEGKIFINGQEAHEYTFTMDYYWMMGDNRHRSADSRFWGFVPETHVVGKPVFCWMSRMNPNDHGESGFRFERMFRLVD